MDVYIVGAKGIGQYGGYETFVQNLIDYNDDIKYHIACKANGDGAMKLNESQIEGDSFNYKQAECYLIKVPELGPAQAIFYDLKALNKCLKEIKKNKINNPKVYVLACRIGPFFKYFVDKIHKLNGKVYINPDGHEWKRAKWNKIVKRYWKLSERLMVKNCDTVVCDSVNIENYIKHEYAKYNPNTTYISYGSDVRSSLLEDEDKLFTDWLISNNLKRSEYYLSVGRFVPENNFETMIREFMQSKSKKDFVLITNVNKKFLKQLEEKLNFIKDPRIKFVGTVYDRELLKKIRENAFAYFHGHEVGGTNPSLLEALASTNLNLLYDVGFNREVGDDSALYWNKEKGNLESLIDNVEHMDKETYLTLGKKAKEIIKNNYSWEKIANEYRKLWNENNWE